MRRRNEGARFSNALVVAAVAMSVGSMSLAVYAALTAAPAGVAFVDTDHARMTTLWVVGLAGLALLMTGGVVAGRRLPREVCDAAVMSGFALIAVVAYLGIQPLRKRLATDLDAVTGPGGTPTTRFALVATMLALAASVCAVASLTAWARDRSRVPRYPRRTTLALATVVVTVVSAGWAAAWTAGAAIDHGPLATAVSPRPSTASLPLTQADHVAFRTFVAAGQTIIVDGQLIVSDYTSVTGRDIESGAIRWEREKSTLAGDADQQGRPEPLIVDRNGSSSTLVLRTRGRTTAIDIGTGAVRWWSDASLHVLGATSGMFVGVRYIVTRAATRSQQADYGKGEFVGLDARTGRVRWTAPVPSYTSDCYVDGGVIGQFALTTGCAGGILPFRVSDGSAMPITQPGRRTNITTTGSTFIVKYRNSSMRNSYDFFEPGSDNPVGVATEDPPLSPLVQGVYLAKVYSPRLDFDLVIRNSRTGATTALPLSSAPLDGTSPNWTESNGMLFGPADASPKEYDPVIASVDPRTRAIESMPSPCLRGGPSRVIPVANRIIVECVNVDEESVLEVVALSAG